MTLVVNQYLSYTSKLCLTGNNQQGLRLVLKKWEKLKKDWNPANIELVVTFSKRPDKVEELIQLIANAEKARDVIRTIHFQDIFSFIYDVKGLADVNSNYLVLEYNINDFKSSATVAIEFQILS